MQVLTKRYAVQLATHSHITLLGLQIPYCKVLREQTEDPMTLCCKSNLEPLRTHSCNECVELDGLSINHN